MKEIFSGLTVIEFASILAGPMVGTFFAELGAHVIKIENKRVGGDATRGWKLPAEEIDTEFSAYYAAANYNKQVIQADLNNIEDYAIAMDRVKNADIVISNFNIDTANKLKVDFETIKTINKKIIYAQLYAYDKYNQLPSYDVVMQAECGYISMCGNQNQPARLPVAFIDLFAADQLKQGILIALLKNSKTPKARLVEVSLYQSAIANLANQASNFLNTQCIPQPIGTLHPNIAPYGDIYICKDNTKIILAIGSDNQFLKLVKTLNLSKKDFITFMKNLDRVSRRDDLNEILQSSIKDYNSNQLTEEFRRKQIPHSLILNLKEVFGHPLARSMVRSEKLGSRHYYGVKSIAFKLS